MKYFGDGSHPERGDESRADSSSPGPRRRRKDPTGEPVDEVLLREISGALVAEQEQPPTPLAMARVIEWTRDCGYSYFVDSDGDIGGMWHGRLFYFLLFGAHDEILQVRGQWNREIALERLEEILEFCNEWNADRIWPKAYTRVRDNGMIQVFTEVTVDLEHGVTDGQLDQLLQCGLSTGSMFFDALDEFYPDPARQAP